MTISWLYLLGGLFFGLIPPRRLINSQCSYMNFRSLRKNIFGDARLGRSSRQWWRLPLVWIDPIRGYVTAFFLAQAFQAAPGSGKSVRILVLVSTYALLLLALWMQAEKRVNGARPGQNQTVSPSVFLAGMILGVFPPMVAIAALVLGLLAAAAMESYAIGYIMAGLATVGSGFMFIKNPPLVLLSGLLASFPFWLSWYRRSSLVMPIRS
jgi:hypothetical protein